MTVDATTTPAAEPTGQNILERAQCLILTVSKFGITRKANLGAVTVNADKELLRLSQKLIEADSYTAIGAVVSRTKQYLKSHALPSMFRNGIWLIPNEMVVDIVTPKLDEFEIEFRAAVETFLAEYPQLVDDMAGPLGTLYNPAHYPSVDRVRAAFDFDYKYVGFDTPGKLRHLSQALFERERDKAAASWTSAAEDIQQVMREGMATLVTQMAESLKDTDDGQKRKLHSKTVEKLRTFLDTFNLRNVTDDQELSALVARAREILSGLGIDDLRKKKQNVDTRAAVQEAFAELAAQIQPLVVKRTARLIDLAEDE